MSLSMRMRSDASTPALPRSDATLQHQSGSLPRLGQSPCPTVASKTFNRKAFHYPFESLSGSLDFVASTGVFADRQQMTMPTAVCVRCAEHASMCMSCTEILCQEALNFYRQTRARGAASLFANAITQTGVTKALKAAVFKLWINGKRYRSRREKKMEFQCEKLFKVSLVRTPFRAWRSFVKTEILERANKKIEDLEAKLSMAEQAVARAVAERNAFEQQAKFTAQQLKGRDTTIESLEAALAEAGRQSEEDKRRIVGLAAISGPLLSLGEVVDLLVVDSREDLRSRLLRCASSTTPAHDFSKCFDVEDSARTLGKDSYRRSSKKKVVKLDETSEIIELLLTWVSAKSREASNVKAADGLALAQYLPKFRVVESVDDLPSGQALLRLVIAVIFDAAVDGKTTLRLPTTMLAAAEEHHREANEHGPAKAAVSLNDELAADVQAPAQSSKEMLAKAVSLAHKYLHLPKYNPKDFQDGRVEVILTFLGQLMLAASAPAQHPSNIQKVGDLIRAYQGVEAQSQAAQADLAGGVGATMASLRDRWAEWKGLKDPEGMPVLGQIAAPAAEEKEPDGHVQRGEGGEGEDEEKGGDSILAADAVAEAAAAALAAAAEAAAAAANDPSVKYAKLISAVDACLAALGPDQAESVMGVGGAFAKQVMGVREGAESLFAVKQSAAQLERTRDKGVKFATELRSAVAAFQYELMLGELGWVGK